MPLNYTIDSNQIFAKVFKADLHAYLKATLGLSANYTITAIEPHPNDSSAYQITVLVAT